MMSDEKKPKIRILPNEIILSEVGRLIEEGHPCIIRVKGYSMLPFIVGDRDSVRLIKATTYHKRDIVLAEIYPGHYVLHRIQAIEGDLPDDHVTLMGDGNLKNREFCQVKNLIGITDIIFRDGKEINPYSGRERFYTFLWLLCLPIRRWLLAIFRRLNYFK